MATEARDRRVNTDERILNDGEKRLPHERDEAPDGQDTRPRGVMEQAASDLEQGLVDTDLHGTRGVEKAVTPTGSGEAKPLDNAGRDMRERPATHRDTRGGK
ncbi:MAG TPA: hypothetical protein VFT37_12345 [Telluria sp.]|nr:hypothetical protein [Telluria sp.]